MNDLKPPFWVGSGLWLIKSRQTALNYAIFSIVLGVIAIAFWNLIAAAYFVAAAWYWLAIRWMNRNEAWSARAG